MDTEQPEDPDDYSMFLDEIGGDVIPSEDAETMETDQEVPFVAMDTALGDIAEEEENSPKYTTPDESVKDTTSLLGGSPPKYKTVQFGLFNRSPNLTPNRSPNRSPSQSPNYSPYGSPSLQQKKFGPNESSNSPRLYQRGIRNLDKEEGSPYGSPTIRHRPVGGQDGGVRFVNVPAKLGVRRSSMTPLGMSSLKGQLEYQRRKMSMPQMLKTDECPFDHTPHPLFVQLNELHYETQWKQSARWIKFEENVSIGANRWGKPHVSVLSFTSLLDLRKCIEQGIGIKLHDNTTKIDGYEMTWDILRQILIGVVLLDLTDTTMAGIAASVTQELCNIHQLENHNRTKLQTLLNHNYKHLDRRRSSLGLRRRSVAIRKIPTFPNIQAADKKPEVQPKNSDRIQIKVTDPDKEEVMTDIIDPSIMRCIPEEAETCTVLVGELEYLEKPIAAFVRLSEGQYIENLTQVPLPARFIFLLLGSSQTCLDYTETGRALGTLMANTVFRESAYLADHRKDLLKAVNFFLDEAQVLPPGGMDEQVLLPIIDIAKDKELRERAEDTEAVQEKPILPFDPLKRTGRPFGCLVNDVKFRYPKYWSDIRDGLNLQSVAAFFFMYFACLTPVITFGELLSDKTSQLLGISELMFGSFILGTMFATISCQPLMLMGASAPFIVFEEALYQASVSFDLDFLSFRLWVSWWTALITVVVVAVEGVFLVRYITGFTKEVFGMLIPLIYIVETFIKVNKYFVIHPLASEYPITDDEIVNTSAANSTTTTLQSNLYQIDNSSNVNISSVLPEAGTHGTNVKTGQPNTALLSMNLTLGTFVIAYGLLQFRNSKYLGKMARRLISDFGVPIAIAVMVLVDVLIRDTYTDKLNVPDGVTPTNASKRGWVVHPLGSGQPLPVWGIFAAIIPGLLLFTLLFMEVLITSMIVNKKERRLQKGPGYNMDMFIIGTATLVSGFLGFPYLSVPIVRCIAQIQSLEVYSRTHAPGEKPKLERVQEHRLVNFCVHVMIGLSTLLGPALREIPIAVLFGVLLFMGVKALKSSVLFRRVLLMLKPPKHHPHVGYITKVRTWRMHIYTALQLVCLAVLWTVKSTKAALAFPFVLIMMVPFRLFVVRRIFTLEELTQLDSDSPETLTARYDHIEDNTKKTTVNGQNNTVIT